MIYHLFRSHAASVHEWALALTLFSVPPPFLQPSTSAERESGTQWNHKQNSEYISRIPILPWCEFINVQTQDRLLYTTMVKPSLHAIWHSLPVHNNSSAVIQTCARGWVERVMYTLHTLNKRKHGSWMAVCRLLCTIHCANITIVKRLAEEHRGEMLISVPFQLPTVSEPRDTSGNGYLCYKKKHHHHNSFRISKKE